MKQKIARRYSVPKKYKVKEIFGPTIQGEGRHAGLGVVFLRFAGCNKWSGREADRAKSVCHFCDTDFVGGDSLTAEEIYQKIKAINPRSFPVVISGGEPMLQLDKELVDVLRVFELHLETNGSICIDEKLGDLQWVIEHVTVSPKQPFKETKVKNADSLKLLYPYLPVVDPQSFLDDGLYGDYYLQPIDDENYERNLEDANNIVQNNSKLRLSLQTHKIIGVE